MQQAAREPVGGRRRCANHPAVPQVGVCDRCGRALCATCAVPVRGRLIGPECLSFVVDQPVPEPRILPAIPPSGDLLSLAGFVLALASTLVRWSRFGGSRAYLGAWTPHWAMLAAVASLAGVGLAAMARFRPLDPRPLIAGYAILPLAGAFGALVHYRHPPLLAESTAAPLVAIVGFAIALGGAVRKGAALIRARRPPPSGPPWSPR
jgi:hypothetical protein